MTKKTTYADSGVDIDLGDEVSTILYNAAKETWKNRKGRLGELIVPFDDFSGVRAIDVSGLPAGSLMNMGFDGVGTKMELAERLGDHSTIAHDLFAMVTDDAVIRGAEPVLIGSILDVRALKDKDDHPFLEQVRQLARGYIQAAKYANVAVVNGEVAEIGNRVGGFGPFNYNWGAGLVWFAKRDRLFTGREIKAGDAVVGLAENGFGSNGLSLVRRVLSTQYGPNWHEHDFNGESLVRSALTPCIIYSGAVCDMFGGFEGEPQAEIHGAAHITGGGIPGKLGRVLKPSGLGATLDNLMDPCPLMLHCQEIGGVTDEESYRTWNNGQRMIVITPDADKVRQVAENHGIESSVVGEVTSKPGIRITSKGYHSRGKVLEFA